ncbi:hypothetical protein ACHAWF_008078 [Thalassiosira exigua]
MSSTAASAPPKPLMFFPAALVVPTWLAVALREDLLVPSFERLYPLTLAMVLGSMIAGSTPLGGGVVAFPVCVLAVGFRPSQGRDFGLLIQSVGMTAASYLVLLTRGPRLLRDHGRTLAGAIYFSVMGAIAGCFVSLPPFVVTCAYTTSVASFAIVLAYAELRLGERTAGDQKNMTTRRQSTHETEEVPPSDCESPSEGEGASDEGDSDGTVGGSATKTRTALRRLALATFSLAGGVVSSQIGTGADMAWYAYGSLVHNGQSEPDDVIQHDDLTAISIIVMTVVSIVGSVVRLSDSADPVSPEVLMALIACAPVVVLGAPTGSLFLGPSHRKKLKALFYVLAFVQLATFGAIKIRDDARAWGFVCGTIGAVVAAVAVADSFVFRKGFLGRKEARRRGTEATGIGFVARSSFRQAC